jgi:tol-pal system protein YbgF
MKKLRALMLLGFCFAAPVHAGLFSDDEARQNIQQVEARVQKIEDQTRQQTQSVLDLQGQIDVLNGQLRDLRGQNEETAHGLQDAEKREKDFYVDLDTRLRHFESIEAAAAAAPKPAEASDAAATDANDPALQNRAIEAAYRQIKAGSYADAVKSLQDFLQKYPDSVYVPDATLWLGNTQFTLKDYKAALLTYRALLKVEPDSARTPDVLFNIALCQRELNASGQMRATLKQLISKYPDSAAAAKAKKLTAESR